MVSRNIMVASAAFMLAVGAACLFIPVLAAAALHHPLQVAPAFQLAAAGPLAFAMMNWLARGQILGGIYGRPLGVANFTNAGILTVVLATEQLTTTSIAGIIASVLFLAYWVSFAWLLFSQPAGIRDNQQADTQ